jgi:hypothetical protein
VFGGDWLLISCPAPGVGPSAWCSVSLLVVVDVSVALLHVPRWGLHAPRVVHPERQGHVQQVPFNAVHLTPQGQQGLQQMFFINYAIDTKDRYYRKLWSWSDELVRVHDDAQRMV